VTSDSVLSARAVSDSALMDLEQKFEVQRVSRDIINYGHATVHALLPGAGEEGQGMNQRLPHSHVLAVQTLTCER
jgi:hypothetical protein